ncbi:MAG: flagellar hook-basal body complex protein FliE [Enterobacteriaceae bacterium]
MDKISAAGIAQSQMKLMQEMQQMASVSAQQALPVSNNGILTPGVAMPSFSQVFNQAIDNVNQIQNSASAKQRAYDMGLSDDLADTMLESQKASVAFSALLQTRNKLTGALDELINMPL